MSYYVTNENSVLNINNAHLRVSGNVITDVMKLGAIEFAPPASNVGGTVNFTNVTTGVTTSSNLSVGGTLSLGTVEVVATTHTLANTTANGNVTPHTVQFSNATTGIVTTANVEVGGELAVSGNVAVDTDTLFVDSVNDRVGVGTTSPQYRLDVGYGGGATSADDVMLRVMSSTGASGKLIFGRSGTTDIRSHAIESYNSSGSQNNYMKFLVHDGTGTSPYETRTEVMTLLGNGNVGIGVTDPGARLDVNGDITVGVSGSLRRTADNDLINIYAGSDNTSPYMFMTGKNRSSNANKIGFRIESNAKLEIYTDKIFIADRVGIGYSAPDSKLDLRNTVIYNGETSTNFNPGTMGLLEFWAANTTATRWNMTVHENNDLYFLCRTSGSGGGSWHQVGYLKDNTPVNNIDFTGQHRNFIDGIPATNYTDFEGLIVSANKNKYFDINENITTGANAIQISQSLPLVSLSCRERDKACFGVISGSEDPDSREYVQGSYVSVIRKQKGDTRAFINSVGEGAIWVTDINGSLESGDYITTSNVTGYGQRQDSEFLANYTVAKITMDCDFDPVTQPVQIIRKETSYVNYWVKTTYENVSEEDYSNLEDEIRRFVDGVYQKITKEESKTEQEGWELEVRQELVNVLDEHGQIQWGDHPTETEKAYKIRYLDADGNITDEANAVHKAAFVGCTYHCG